MLGRRGFALESGAASCREAGARVGTNVMVRDMDLLPQTPLDTRRLEVVADGLPCHSSTALSWRLTPQWCLQSGGMDYRDHGVSAPTEQHWQQPDA